MPDDTDNITTEHADGQDAVLLGYRVITDRSVTHAHYSYVSIHSNAAVVKMVKHQKQANPPKHVRGVITRFSPRSRSRMMRKTGQIRGLARPFFVTLTYPGQFTSDPRRVKEHLANLRKRLKRRFPFAGMLWRLELKTRKTGASCGEIVPHYHLLLWGINAWEKTMHTWLIKAWFEIVWGDDCELHHMPPFEQMTKAQQDFYEHAVDVEQLYDFRHVLSYVAKYSAKTEDDETSELWGRRWGVALSVDCSHTLKVGLTWTEHLQLRREIRKLLEKRQSKYAWWLKSAYPSLGFSVLGLGDNEQRHEIAVNSAIVRIISNIKGWDIDGRTLRAPFLSYTRKEHGS
jgi:hypothetical protein